MPNTKQPEQNKQRLEKIIFELKFMKAISSLIGTEYFNLKMLELKNKL